MSCIRRKKKGDPQNDGKKIASSQCQADAEPEKGYEAALTESFAEKGPEEPVRSDSSLTRADKEDKLVRMASDLGATASEIG